MGDVPVPPPSTSANDHSTQAAYSDPLHGSNLSGNPTAHPPDPSVSSVAHSQYQPQPDPPQYAFSTQFDMTKPHGTGRGAPQTPYNMTAMASALSQSGFRPGANNGNGQQRYSAGGPMPGAVPHMPPYPRQPVNHHLVGQPYYMAQQAQMPHYYNDHMHPGQHQSNLSPRHNMSFYPNQVMMGQSHQQIPAGYYYPQPSHYPAHSASMHGSMFPTAYVPTDHGGTSPGGTQEQAGVTSYNPPAVMATENQNRAGSGVVRGPPRKPRQSGHAIWIGNLPPQTELMSLVHHVCKEAAGLESLFLISKSNCAFANFKDEQSCIQAQQKLHDSKFQSVRLVSRLRKSTVEGSSGQTAPTGPSATSPPSGQTVPAEPAPNAAQQPATESDPGEAKPAQDDQVDGKNAHTGESGQQTDKFFVLKSLTVEDLELSVRNGVWATQSHNEESLNNAYTAADNVYLVFSANKSGEYFGYARMISPINNDPAAAIEFAPKAQATNDLDLPKAIPTEATEHCPRGNIIDDSARGTIFWEVEREDGEGDDSEETASTRSGADGEGGSKAWGKPFKLEWLSTTRLPFYRTRGLRNPWNSNREVKIARDGTELEPSVGRRLIGLFNRVQSPAPVISLGMRPAVPVVAGYPPPPSTMRVPYAPQQ